jgi:Spy/CpxP family protein refolding chaperone
MKKQALLSLLFLILFFTNSIAQKSSKSQNKSFETEEVIPNKKLNNKRLEKNLDRFAEELDLSKSQLKQLKKIDKRYTKKARKLSKKDSTKKRDLRNLDSDKREEMLYVLTADQQRKLEVLSKKGRFSFENWFSK